MAPYENVKVTRTARHHRNLENHREITEKMTSRNRKEAKRQRNVKSASSTIINRRNGRRSLKPLHRRSRPLIIEEAHRRKKATLKPRILRRRAEKSKAYYTREIEEEGPTGPEINRRAKSIESQRVDSEA